MYLCLWCSFRDLGHVSWSSCCWKRYACDGLFGGVPFLRSEFENIAECSLEDLLRAVVEEISADCRETPLRVLALYDEFVLFPAAAAQHS